MKKLVCLLLAVGLCLSLLGGAFAEAGTDSIYDGYTQEEFDALTETTVIKSDASPTGYYVTFRYVDADATRVRINGEWCFSTMLNASPFTFEDKTPEEWENGDIVLKSDWPWVDMVKNEETGIWSYTIPLPNGTWGYTVYVGGDPEADIMDRKDTVQILDPGSVNNYWIPEDVPNVGKLWNYVYVPYDEVKQSDCITYLEEEPRQSEKGSVLYGTAAREGGFSEGRDVESINYAVYLPYEFDENREDAYPVMVVVPGGSDSYAAWFNNGLVNILDNMIAEGRLEPTVVVSVESEPFMPNKPHSLWDYDILMDTIVNYILPDMSANYNVSEDPARRAMAGSSMAGTGAAYALFNNTDDFDTFIILSAPMLTKVNADYTIPGLADKHIFVGYGDFDYTLTRSLYKLDPDEEGNMVGIGDTTEGSVLEYIYGFGRAGIPVKSYVYPLGHDWVLWRKLIVKAFDEILWK